MYGVDTKEVVAFVKTIPAGTSGSLKERIKANGTVEEIVVRFYAGQERELQVRPRLRRTGGREEDLVTFPTGGETWLSGEDDRAVLDISVPCETDDEIVIFYSNTNGTYDYTLNVQVTVDYMEGRNRA